VLLITALAIMKTKIIRRLSSTKLSKPTYLINALWTHYTRGLKQQNARTGSHILVYRRKTKQVIHTLLFSQASEDLQVVIKVAFYANF
jgi:hypothetical protein